MAMGRKRKTNQLGLDPKKHARLYPKHGAFYYVHKDNRWERLRATILRADQAYRSSVFHGGFIADLLKADLDKEPVVIEDRALSKTLFEDQPKKSRIMGKD